MAHSEVCSSKVPMDIQDHLQLFPDGGQVVAGTYLFA